MNNPISQPYFQCERLDVYRIAVKFHRSIVPLRQVRGAADLRDQILRASESIVLNIAEGAGRYSIDDKRRFYRMASGSAMECAGALELLHNRGIFSDAGYQARRDLLIRIVQMLARLCGPPR
jgi:four helix bundle protein